MEAGECYYHHNADELGDQVVNVGTITAKSANPSAHEPMGLKSFYYVPMPRVGKDPSLVVLGLYSRKAGKPQKRPPRYPDWAKELWEQPFFRCAAGLLANWDWAFEQSLHDALRALGSALPPGGELDPHAGLLQFVLAQDTLRAQVCWRCEVVRGLEGLGLVVPEALSGCCPAHKPPKDCPIRDILALIRNNYEEAYPTHSYTGSSSEDRPELRVEYRKATQRIGELTFRNSARYVQNRLERYWMIRQGRPPAGRPAGRWGGYGLLLAQRAARKLGGDLRVDLAIPKDNEEWADWSVTLRWRNP